MILSISENYSFETQEYTNNNLEFYTYCFGNPPVFNCSQESDELIELQAWNLGLESFSASAVSIYVDEDKYIMYVADSSFGLRALNLTVLNKPVLVGNYAYIETAVSIGVCGDYLFVGTYEESLYKYNLTNPYYPRLAETFFKLGNHTGARGSIKCSSEFDPQFVAVPLFNDEGNFTIRIVDLYEGPTFSIFAEIVLEGTNATSYPGAFEFSDSSTLSVVSGSTKSDYALANPILTYPAMSKAQYEGMLAKWNTNLFSLSISVNSSEQSLKSNLFYLERLGPDSDDSHEDSSGFMLVFSILSGW
eukprot:CAMPEP_0204914812 /NCGR_PEP_ID=MMETSP1397-20131031/12714_1 /ASSEMBLY_ACC=CAM_ASM_000891 /TAXON_ID=49980 /ORGANISM="Climacostomum Climacostomum virens, Strain Stock W-24" /LENGTH=303 /DNA_ID=CAMNT_0052086551 /DNA_START=57 /DNA_END=965 /DNA_ORIENTATION=-